MPSGSCTAEPTRGSNPTFETPFSLHRIYMADRASTSRRRRFPLRVEVQNEFDKGYGLLPSSMTSEFGSKIGSHPTITDQDGKIYHVQYQNFKGQGILINGWCKFVEYYDLEDFPILILEYIGESFFKMDIEHQLKFYCGSDSDFDDANDRAEVQFNQSNLGNFDHIMQHIVLSGYTASNEQLYLPVNFVKSSVNLNLTQVTIQTENQKKWTVGLYHTKRRKTEARLSTRWKQVCSDLRLKAKDTVIFEVLDPNTNLIKIHVRRA